MSPRSLITQQDECGCSPSITRVKQLITCAPGSHWWSAVWRRVLLHHCLAHTTLTEEGQQCFVLLPTVRHELTHATPSHNGVAERMNRTLFEMNRAMLGHARLPPAFWEE